MLIYPQGLLDGERLAECSDEAQLHFPRLAALANGFGRMKLSEKEIIENAYKDFRHRPTREDLTVWLKEYSQHYLLLIYTADDRSLWGQWCGVPENALPRYTTKADKQSPPPPPGAVEAFDAAYTERKRERSVASGDFLDISENFRNVPKPSKDLETFPPVVVVVGGVVDVGVGVEEERQIPLSSAAPDEKNSRPASSAKPNSRGYKSSKRAEKPYDLGFLRAYELYPKHEEKSEAEGEYLAALESLQGGIRDKPPMVEQDARQFIEEGAAAYAVKMKTEGREPSKIKSMNRWFSHGTYLDYEPRPKATFVPVSPEEFWANEEISACLN